MLDFPEPLRPVIALKDASQPVMVVLTGYDLKPFDENKQHVRVNVTPQCSSTDSVLLTLKHKFLYSHSSTEWFEILKGDATCRELGIGAPSG